MTASFDLTTQPWIRIRSRDGTVRSQSLSEVFARAHQSVALAGELPTQDVAVLRLLLAVLRRACEELRTTGDWGELWRAGSFDRDRIDRYLERHQDRFDLLHPATPFFQVAGLRTAKGDFSEVVALLADVPNNHKYFTTRAATGLVELPFEEAARWVVHCQSYDPSGIKSGAIGDDRVKGGKGYPIGVGWVGNLGCIVIEGNSLFETLMLNLPVDAQGDDLPIWEREHPTATVQDRSGPTGPVDLFTWQSRRIRLGHDAADVRGVLIANGDALHARNRFRQEPMTSWRFSENQTKLHGEQVHLPRQHAPDRALWRGLSGVLAETAATESTRTGLPGRWLMWIVELLDEGELDGDYPLTMRAVGMHYGSNNSVVDDVTDDRLVLSAVLLGDRPLRQLAVAAVEDADRAVRALADLAADLAEAAGKSGDTAAERSAAREVGYAGLEGLYRRWLRILRSDTDVNGARTSWQQATDGLLRQVGRRMTEDAGPAAWVGREVSRGPDRSIYLDAALAESSFRRRLREALPDACIERDGIAGGARI